MRKNLAPAVVGDAETQRVAVEVRSKRLQFGRQVRHRHGRHDGRQLLPDFFGKQPGAAGELAASEQHAHPPRHVLGVRVDPARRVRVVAFERADLSGRSLDACVSRRHVSTLCGGGVLHVTAAHADRPEDLRRHEVLPALTADGFDDFAGDQVQHVVVRVGAPEARGRRNEADSTRDLLAVVGGFGPPQQISGAEAETAPVHQQIPNGQLARDPRVPHLKPRHVSDDRRVPLDLPCVDEDPECRRCEHLRVRRDAEQGLRVHRSRIAQRSHAVPPGDDDPSILDDREREPGDFERLQRFLHDSVEVRRRRAR